MADNLDVTPGTGATVAADLIAGALHQRVKVTVGADGTNDGDVSAANPLPVVQTGTPGLPTGAATAAKQLADGHNVVVTGCALPTGAATAAKQLADGHGVVATLSATDNAVLDAIQVGTDKITACNTGAVVLAAGTAEVGKLAAGSAIIGKVGIDQTTDGTTNKVVATSGTAANCKVEATIAAAQTVAVTNAGTFAVQAAAVLGAETTKVIGTVNVAASQTIAVTSATAANLKAELGASTAAIGKLAANSGVDIGDVDVTSIAAGTNKIGDVDIAPRATGGWSVMNATSGDAHTALTGTAQVIKASAGKFGGYYIMNPNAAAIWVHVYNIAAASVTVGTSTALLNFCIPAGAAANIEFLAGIAFDTAMSWAATTTGGGNTNPTTALEAMCWFI